MDPITGAAVITGGSNVLGGYIASQGQESANRANLAIAREQMQFQERMSNTAYQRAMDDMKKAGLNPMLAFSKGGASTPGGASATMGNESASFGAGVSAAGSAAGLRRVMTEAQVDNMQETNANLRMQNALLAEQVKAASATAQVAESKIPEAQAYARYWAKYGDGQVMSTMSKPGTTVLSSALKAMGLGPATAQEVATTNVGENLVESLKSDVKSGWQRLKDYYNSWSAKK